MLKFVYSVMMQNDDHNVEPPHPYHDAQVELPIYEAVAIQQGKWQYVHKDGFTCNVCGNIFHPTPGWCALKEG
jgi:hypothetical protein